MHQPRPLAVFVGSAASMPSTWRDGARTALHRQPVRLVDDEHVIILEQGHRLEFGQCLPPPFLVRPQRRLAPHRGNADLLPRLQPILGIGALAVDAQLALAHHALDMGEGETRNLRFEEAVDPHAGFVFGHDDILDAG